MFAYLYLIFYQALSVLATYGTFSTIVAQRQHTLPSAKQSADLPKSFRSGTPTQMFMFMFRINGHLTSLPLSWPGS